LVWLSKREIAYYLILKKRFNGNIFNIGEALDVLIFFGSKNIAKKIIKRLKSKGFLESVGIASYRIRDEEEVLVKLLSNYISERLYRNLKLRGYGVSLNKLEGYNVIEVNKCDSNVFTMLDVVRELGIEMRCIDWKG